MSKVTIQALDDSPLVIKGEVELLDGEGNVMEISSNLHLCRCGLSKSKPYCDGTHVGKFKNEVRKE